MENNATSVNQEYISKLESIGIHSFEELKSNMNAFDVVSKCELDEESKRLVDIAKGYIEMGEINLELSNY